MKVTIILFVFFVAAKQISSEKDGKANVSNETIASNNETVAGSMFKNIADFLKNIVPTRKKNDSSLTRENSTYIPSNKDLSLHNSTQDHFTNSSAEVNSTIGTVKLEETSSNTTSENVSTANSTEHESKILLTKNSTLDELPIHNATQEHFTNISTVQDNLSNIASSSEEPNKLTTRDIPNLETIDESTKIPADVDSSSSDKDVTIPPERDTYESTEITSEVSKLDPQQHQNYCASYIDKLLTATFTEFGDQLDPLQLEDRRIGIENTFLLSKLKGEVGLYDGKVTGMSKAISFGKCNVQIRDNQVRLRETISFDEAELSYKGRATFLEFGPKITVNGKLSGSLVELQIVVPKDGGIGEVKSVRVRDIGRMEVDVKGLGPIDWALGLIGEEMARVFSLNFQRSVERELRGALEEEIKKINYP